MAISGGLEVASDRLLKLMKKGVSVEQVARVTKGFSDFCGAGAAVCTRLTFDSPKSLKSWTVPRYQTITTKCPLVFWLKAHCAAKQYSSPSPPVPFKAVWLHPPRDWCDEFHEVAHGSALGPTRSW
jgi:hypothetical protein